MLTSRRSFLTGLGAALITAPAIVRAGSLMPVKAIPPTLSRETMQLLLMQRMEEAIRLTRLQICETMFGDQYIGYDVSKSLDSVFPVMHRGAKLEFD